MDKPVVLDEGVVVLSLSGKIMGGDECQRFRDMIREQIDLGHKRFVVNCQRVDWMNSYGLAMLIAGLVSVQNAGGHFALANVDSIQDLLKTTRLELVFDIFDSLDRAKKAVQQD